ncbi:unnamed protein product [Hanseniaspora opuntiae]
MKAKLRTIHLMICSHPRITTITTITHPMVCLMIFSCLEISSKPNIQMDSPEVLNKSNSQRESPDIEDNPFETYQANSNTISSNNDDSHFLDMNEHLPHKAGFFSTPFDILQKGKTFIQEQFSLNDDLLRKEVFKSSTNLLDYTVTSPPQDSVPNGFITNISSFEKDSYYDFKGQGVSAFKIGHYDLALRKIQKCIRVHSTESHLPSDSYKKLDFNQLQTRRSSSC